MSAPRASIILPTFNGERDLRRLLPALARQDFSGGFEICAVDSSSSDATRALLEAAGAHVETIDKSEFRHGATRNRCASRARGEFLVFLSQDVEPTSEHFLARLIDAFDDPRVAGAYSRVLPRPDDDPLTQRTVLASPEASTEPCARDLDRVGDVEHLSGRERADYLRFNNVASAIRATVFREIPFPDIAFGEDFAWASRALTAGWRIRFAPQSVVYHAHRYTPAKVYERYRVDAAFHRLIHGHRVRPSALSALRGFIYEVRADARFIFTTHAPHAARHLLMSPCLRAAQVFGQWVGSNGWSGGPNGEATGRMR
jgi:rhamnosyltransferase